MCITITRYGHFAMRKPGAMKPDIKAVREITAGHYWGCLVARAGKMTIVRSFKPKMILRFPSHVELIYLRLARHPAMCPA